MKRQMFRSAVVAALFAALMFGANPVAQSARRALVNLRGYTDGVGNLMVVATAAQGTPSARRDIGNLMARTDASGNLMVALASGSVVAAADGTATAPSMAFASQLGTGWFYGGAGKVGLGLGGGTTPMILFGGTTSAFPALKRGGANLEFRLADDSGYTQINANSVAVLGGSYKLGASATMYINVTAPTVSSGFGTSPSIVNSNGTVTFRVNVGTGGVATSGVLAMPASTTGWNCMVNDMTNNTVTRQTASTTTSVTVTAAAAWAASDVLNFVCFGF